MVLTYRQVIEAFKPERIRDTACGGVVGCPSWYGLECNPPEKCNYSEEGCTKCWDRTCNTKEVNLNE